MRHCSSRLGLARCFSALAFLLAGSSLATPAAAQEYLPSNSTPPSRAAAGVPISVVQPSKPSVPPHAFCDRTNVMLFSGVALLRSLDYASTRNMQARGREEILLPDDVVNNSAGFAGLEAASVATSVGFSYWMHRTGHHRIERWVSIVHIGVTGFGVGRNYALESRHPPPQARLKGR